MDRLTTYFKTTITSLAKVSINLYRGDKSSQRSVQENVPQEDRRAVMIVVYLIILSDLR